jgi:hypothetical protein
VTPTRTADPIKDPREAIRAYEGRIRDLLEWCAEHQQHNPEVFLWNARRALEAICHLLLTVHHDKPSRVDKSGSERSLDSMIKELEKAGLVDRVQAPRFEMARSHTNLGVHIQQPEKENYSAPVRSTAHVLPELLEWLYFQSAAKPHLGPYPHELVELIRAGGRSGLPPKEAADAARRAQEKAEEAARRAQEEAEAKTVKIERELKAKERELDEKTEQLNARRTGQWKWIGRMLLVGSGTLALGLCTGGAGASLLPDLATAELKDLLAAPAPPPAPKPATPAPPPAAAPQVATPAVAAPAPATSGASATAPAAAPPGNLFPAVAPPPTCPTGMLLIPETKGMLLGQPVGGRKNWPPPARRAIPPHDVPAFCIDATPRPRANLSRSRYDAARVDHCERNILPADRPAARTCLTRDEAERICKEDVSGGRLPSVLQWEAAFRAHLPGLTLPEHEWSGERFPPEVFLRSAPDWDGGDGMWVGRIPKGREPERERGNVMLAWNQQPPENRSEERGFRCAKDLGG